jgi:uncharacterized membrane protein YraQ (UPF0718 family)
VNTATAILGIVALGMSVGAWRKGDGSLQWGLGVSWGTLKRTLPRLLIAFAIVGYVDVLAPQTLVQTWIGPETGTSGLLIGELIGLLLPGGPYVIFPLISALYQAGAGLGPVLSMITSWALLALLSVSFEIPFLGWRFTAIRFALALPIPLLVGLAGALLNG